MYDQLQETTLYPVYRQPANHVALADFVSRYGAIAKSEKREDAMVSIAGRVMSRRDSSAKLVFMDVLQGDATVQAVVSAGRFAGDMAWLLKRLRRGDIVEVQGMPGKTKTGELSIFAQNVRLLAPCLHDLPRPNTLKDPSIRTRQRYLDMLVNPEPRRAFLTRAKALRFLRSFLDDRDFVEVETPVLAAQAGGANARPFVTHSNVMHTDFTLRIAPELFLKQLVIGGLERVYEIGKVFRNEGIDGTHSPEFSSCEFYVSYMDFEHLMRMTEELLSGMVNEIHGSRVLTYRGTDLDFGPPFARISLMETLELETGEKLDMADPGLLSQLERICQAHGVSLSPPVTVATLLDRLIGHFVEPLCVQPTFVYDFPKVLSPLAKDHPTKPGLTERFELYVNGKELCNAYMELNDPAEQERRFLAQEQERAQGDLEAQLPDAGFVRALEYGLPPTAGWGMGLDRLVMLLTDNVHIREVLTFPLQKPQQPVPAT